MKNALANGKLLEAARILKQGRDAIDAELTVIVEEAKEIRVDVMEDVEKLGQEFYEETAAEAEAVTNKIRDCIQNGSAPSDSQ